MKPCPFPEGSAVHRVVDAALAAGYSITVFDGGVNTLNKSKEREEILASINSTDEDYLMLFKDGRPVRDGWIRFIYDLGKPPEAVDHSVALDAIMKAAGIFVDSEFEIENKDDPED